MFKKVALVSMVVLGAMSTAAFGADLGVKNPSSDYTCPVKGGSSTISCASTATIDNNCFRRCCQATGECFSSSCVSTFGRQNDAQVNCAGKCLNEVMCELAVPTCTAPHCFGFARCVTPSCGGFKEGDACLYDGVSRNFKVCGGISEPTPTPTPTPPVHCAVSAWSDWSTCTATCNGGTQTRTRTVITPACNGGNACPPLTETQPCNQQACPVNWVVSEWSSWGCCSAQCGGGVQKRTRTILTPSCSGGAGCPNLEETQPCNQQACTSCGVSEWSTWSACSKSCGGGQQFRFRSITTTPAVGGAACPTDLTEAQACNTQDCPKDCCV